ncbi:hypothetical protein [Streptomyces aureoverticillatus]|uniref:hypothetical protein n=1 Tax=Streptomyces aureoverticillatus TaxID=66871 RepID=UPI0013DB6F89|nr:hypothetical protein [Streptomyces aureoverticillatus]QIB47065.1 hypothetical protein G3H79_32265 [Streptomyces aureoverticillatus]
MWPGQQQPGGEQNPQDQGANPYQQPGYQQPNPYQQPGYQQAGHPQQPGHPQPGPYQQPVGQHGQWSGAPTPLGAPQPPTGSGGGGGNRTKVIAIVAAAAVVVAAGVTGFLLLGGDKDDEAGKAGNGDKKGSSEQASEKPSAPADGDDDERGTDGGPKATVPGWQAVVNPKWGTAFDVPPDWQVEGPNRAINFEEHKTGKPIATMGSPAVLKPKWCTSDEDKDGRSEDVELSAAGTKGGRGGKNTDEVAVNTVGWWIYGAYTQPDKKTMTYDEKAKPYTTKSGIKGSIAWGRSTNTPQKGKCASDGKAISFGFKNSEGDFVSWSLYGARGVKEEVPDATIMKILATVRLYGEPTG